MKIILDEFLIWELSPIMQKVIQNDIKSEIFQDDMARRLRWAIESKYEACFKRLKDEWDSKLETRGIDSIPTNKDKYAELVFSQHDYKNRSEKENNVNSGRL